MSSMLCSTPFVRTSSKLGYQSYDYDQDWSLTIDTRELGALLPYDTHKLEALLCTLTIGTQSGAPSSAMRTTIDSTAGG